ncbi:MAG: hypothetical protein WBN56_07130, partial [Robiginitalea sp.]|uniref:hypothetical protein n=1 Tax=Robiginitalea sp. TaxID=1902411 RepID=UPI003C717B50
MNFTYTINNIAYKLFSTLVLFLAFGFFWNCTNDDEFHNEKQEQIFSTVSFSQALSGLVIFEQKENSDAQKRNGRKKLSIEPNWDTFKYLSLDFTEAKAAYVNVKLNVKTRFDTKVVFLGIDGKNIRLIESSYALDFHDDGTVKNGRVYYHRLDGSFIDGYLISQGKIIKRIFNPVSSSK